MSWKKYFKAPNTGGGLSPINGGGSAAQQNFKFQNYGSLLPEVYMGHPNRIERYNQFESMDLDSEVNSALDIIGEFCTQPNEQNGLAFDIHYHDKPTETEIGIIKKQLQAWCSLNQFDRRTFKMFRNVLKYGDQVFVRDPETFKLMWVDMSNLLKIIVNESDGKVPEQYVIRNINPNLENMSVTQVSAENLYYSQPNTAGSGASAYNTPNSPFSNNSRFMHGIREITLDAENILHLSLTEGLDGTWPFGNSILENIFKVYKQKELLEDCIVIYRVQRAPERRVFKIDTGNMPSHMAMAFVERVKNEIHQRRIPNSNGGCFVMDTMVPLLDGRMLTIAQLASEHQSGKENWVYSCDPANGKMVPGLISWAGITRKNAQVVKLTLDSGETIICTPDHKFPIIGKGKVAAEDIVINADSLISFNTRLYSINDTKKTTDPQYQQVYDHSTNQWKFTHRAVASFLKDTDQITKFVYDASLADKDKKVIHHKNFNKYDNFPSNLVYMNGYDHFKLHSNLGKEFWASQTPEQRANYKEKRKTLWDNRSDEFKQNQIQQLIAGGKTYWGALRNDDLAYGTRVQQLTKNLIEKDKPWCNQNTKWNSELYTILVNTVISSESSLQQTVNLLSENLDFMKLYAMLNQPIDGLICKIKFDKFCVPALKKLLKIYGFAKWRDFIKSLNQNIKRPSRKITIDHTVLSFVVNTTVKHGTNKNTVVKHLNKTPEFMQHFATLNQNIKGNAKATKFTASTMSTCILKFGFNSWTDFCDKIPQYNHKVVKIERLADTIDVGTLTIDGHEKYHNFHTFAINQGVYTFNSSFMDSTYNPMSTNEDYFFPQTAEGRGSSVDILQGGQNLGEIDDLKFFTNKMFRGLRIPSSYLPTGAEDSAAVHNDGKVATALIQEHRFNQYCMRLQALICKPLDTEFKAFLMWRGFNLDNTMFELRMNEPQNFAKYRQAEVDTAKISSFSQLEQTPYMSKRFMMKRYLGLSEEEILENNKMWREENTKPEDAAEVDSSLKNVGITSGNMESDLESLTPPEPGPTEIGAEPITATPVAPPPTGTAPAA